MGIHPSLRNRVLLQKIVRSYKTRIEELEQKHHPVAQSNFVDITRNLIQLLLHLEGTDYLPLDILSFFRTQMVLDLYLGLAQRSPSFLDREMHTQGGYFPDRGLSGEGYVDYALYHLE